MQRILWVSITLLIGSCSSSTNSGSTAVVPHEKLDRDGSTNAQPIHEELGHGISATHCPLKRPFRSWGDYESQSSLCERLGQFVAICELPQKGRTPSEICRDQDVTSDRAVVVEAECLGWTLKAERVPGLIDRMLECVQGPFHNEGRYPSIPCPVQMTCLRNAGIEWTERENAEWKKPR